MLPTGAVWRGRYKLIEWFEGTVARQGVYYELFDLELNVSETRNLVGSHPKFASYAPSWRPGASGSRPRCPLPATECPAALLPAFKGCPAPGAYVSRKPRSRR